MSILNIAVAVSEVLNITVAVAVAVSEGRTVT